MTSACIQCMSTHDVVPSDWSNLLLPPQVPLLVYPRSQSTFILLRLSGSCTGVHVLVSDWLNSTATVNRVLHNVVGQPRFIN